MLPFGGAAVNLRPVGCTVKTYEQVGKGRHRESFVEMVLETLFSDHTRCQQIRKKISLKDKSRTISDLRVQWHASIAKQVADLQRRGFLGVVRDSFELHNIKHSTGFKDHKKK
tara:strand:+ start:117 stop:455 length:339 start_codon:yes stop_codon:yes gene_type:complete